MANDVDIRIRLEAEKAKAQLAKFNAEIVKAEESVKRATASTQTHAELLNNKLANATAKARIEQEKLARTSLQQSAILEQRLNAATAKAAQNQEQAALKSQILRTRLENLENGAKGAGSAFSVLNISLASFIGNITSRAVSFGVTSIINGVKGVINSGREFEDGLVSIGKTTGISGSALQKLGDDITSLSRKIPVSTKTLLEFGTVAGQLGLKSSQDIVQFTETLGKLTLASDVTGEAGAQSVARILTVTGELEKNGSENIDKFGNVITRLGNNFAATESQILEVANKVAQGTAPFGVASEDVLAIATALKATGSEAEASGTAIQKTFQLIGKATQEGGQNLRNFANAAGLTNEQFTALFKSDPAKLFLQLAKNLGQTGVRGAELNKVFSDLGLEDVRLTRSLNPLISNYQQLERAINDARTEAQDKIALDEEASKAADTLSGDIQSLSNAFDELSKNIFAEVGPSLRALTQGLTQLIKSAIDLTKNEYFQSIAEGISQVNSAVLDAIPGISTLRLAYEQIKQLAPEKQFETLNVETQNYLGTLTELATFTEEQRNNFVELRAELDLTADATRNLVETNEILNASAQNSAASVQLFEQEKLSNLRKFFKEEEALKLESKFKTIENIKEQEAFSKFVQQEGQRRQQEAFAATIGLDKATLDAKRAHQQELKKLAEEEKKRLEELRSGQEQHDNFLRQQDYAREDAYRQSLNNLALAEEEYRLQQLGNNQIFTDQRLIAVQNFYTAEQEAAIQAKLNAAKTEQERQTIINNILADSLRKRQQMEETANRLRLQGAASTLGGIADLLALGGKKNFEAVKAFSIAESTIRGILQVQQALSQPPGPPITVPYAIGVGVQAAARTAQIAAQRPSFEQGGIVGGTSFTGDKIDARVNSGEMILNRAQQAQLFAMANGGGSNNQPSEIVVHTKIQIQEETIAEAVSRQVANGLVLGEVQ